MSDVETALTGAEVAPVANADTPQVEQANAPDPTTEQVDTPKDDKPRDEKGRFVPQERVNEITRARREAERERDYWRNQAEQRQQAANSQPRQQSNEAPPSLEQYPDIHAWSQAVTDYAVRQAQAGVEDRLRGHDQQRTQQHVAQQFGERSRAYAASNPGFEDRVADLDRSVQLQPELVEAIALSEQGPAVVDYLATHLDEADRIARLPPHIAAVQLGRIEAQVSAPKPKPVSKAPDPVPTVGGGAAAPKDPDRMTGEEWLAWRQNQLTTARHGGR